MGTGADEESVCGFFQEDYDKFKDFISGKAERDFDVETLIPEGVAFNIEEYKKDILGQMEHLKKSVEEFPEEYREEDGAEKSVLYAFLERGIFPTYSFPKDVVGFYVEKERAKRLIRNRSALWTLRSVNMRPDGWW